LSATETISIRGTGSQEGLLLPHNAYKRYEPVKRSR
jgi:hypothetical protein